MMMSLYHLCFVLTFTVILVIEVSSNRVQPLSFGGDYIKRGDSPWLCPLFLETEEGVENYICGSSLITNTFVLTAAHCIQQKKVHQPVYPLDVIVYCGKFDLKNTRESHQQRVVAKHIHPNPNWDYTTERYDGDLALIELTQPMKFSQFIQRISLPPAMKLEAGTNGRVIGYGRSENATRYETIPRKIEIPIVDLEECYQGNTGVGVVKYKSKDAFCAGRTGVAPCSGDSGSSFHIDVRKAPTIVGIVSLSFEGTNKLCNDETYAIFVDITKYIDWIKNTVGSGFIVAGTSMDYRGNSDDEDVIDWKPNEAFCEYIIDDGYRCHLRNVRSSTNDDKITRISGQHQDRHDDGDVIKIWIVEQTAIYIPEMSEMTKKFPRIRDLRIWTCGLKFIERQKLAIFDRLAVLDLFNNHIEHIPSDAFDDLNQLVELKILNNRVKELNADLFKNLRNLVYFFSENNEIEELPEHFFDNTNIAVVNLKNNRLRKVYVDFRKLRNVNNIDFDGNRCMSKCLGHYCSKMSIAEFQNEINQKCN